VKCTAARGGFNFKGSDQQKRVGDLPVASATAHLAKALLMAPTCSSTSPPMTDDDTPVGPSRSTLLEFPGWWCLPRSLVPRSQVSTAAAFVLEGDSEVVV
jgi:hypothetical protein